MLEGADRGGIGDEWKCDNLMQKRDGGTPSSNHHLSTPFGSFVPLSIIGGKGCGRIENPKLSNQCL